MRRRFREYDGPLNSSQGFDRRQRFDGPGKSSLAASARLPRSARLICLIHGAKNIAELPFDDDLQGKGLMVTGERCGEGIASMEGPRGTLIHRDAVDDNDQPATTKHRAARRCRQTDRTKGQTMNASVSVLTPALTPPLTPPLGSAPATLPIVSSRPRVLVIGYGNPGRQDDGLGPAAACAIDRLGWPNVATIDDYQLTIEDAVEVAAHDVVWFVDASCEGDAPCAVRRLSPAFDITFTSHLVKPETVLALAAQQFRRCPQAHLVSIRGYEFGFREELSARAYDNLVLAVALLRRRIGHVSGGPR